MLCFNGNRARHMFLEAFRILITFVSSTPPFVTENRSPGATLTSQEKLEIACILAKLGVDSIIGTSFPIASPYDFSAVNLIADTVGSEVFEDGYARPCYSLWSFQSSKPQGY